MDKRTTEKDINEVLKALNHEIRRKIIRLLHTKNHPVVYSEFLDELNVPASSNAAYHLHLLTKSNIVKKTPNGYSLTELGSRVALLLDIVVEPQSTAFTNLFMGFARLSPFEILLGSWWLFFLLLGIYTFTHNIFIGFISISFAILSVGILIYKTHTPWSIILINNFLWILFAPDYRTILLLISITNISSLLILFPDLGIVTELTQFFWIFGVLLISLSIILSIAYIYLTQTKLE